MIGIDIVHIPRIERAVRGESFLTHVFTPSERAYCDGKAKPHIHYAGMFAAKEAAVKALKRGFSDGLRPLDVEIRHDCGGAPELTFFGEAAKLVCGKEAEVSISHDGEYATAVVFICQFQNGATTPTAEKEQ